MAKHSKKLRLLAALTAVAALAGGIKLPEFVSSNSVVASAAEADVSLKSPISTTAEKVRSDRLLKLKKVRE